MIEIVNAARIDGWMTGEELTWLAEQATTHMTIVEIGSYKGRSTRVLAEHTLGRVFAIDDWRGVNRDNLLDDNLSLELYNEFSNNLIDLILTEKVIPLKQNHLSDPNDFIQLSTGKIVPDMVFIDGDHSYSAVKNDIATWMPKLINSGLLCGHDSGYDGVRQAISEIPGGYNLVAGTTIWYVIKEVN